MGMGGYVGQLASDPKRAGAAAVTLGASELYRKPAMSGERDLGNMVGIYNDKGKEDQARIGQSQGEQADALQGSVDKAYGQGQQTNTDYDKAYQTYTQGRNKVDDRITGQSNDYIGRQQGLLNQASSQASDASKTYSNTIKPRLNSVMEDAQRQAAGAMTLQQAGDANNDVARQTRQLYENQAQGEGKRGIADYGVMSALGAQATAGQLGGASPLTGGQLQAIQGANMSQAAQAYGNVQKRMQNLRDQGLNQGFARSDLQYQRGQDAQSRYRQSIGDISAAQNDYLGQQQNLRGEQSGYGGNIFDTQAGMANRDYNNIGEDLSYKNSSIGRTSALDQGNALQNQGLINTRYGNQQAALQSDLAGTNAAAAGRLSAIGGLIGAGAGAYGASQGMGGGGAGGGSPMQGAQSGAQIGSSIFGGLAGNAGQSQQQYPMSPYQPQRRY